MPSPRLWRRLLGGGVFALVFVFASTGIRWSQFFHPDELPVAHWMRQTHEQGYISERAYPGGWFVLAEAHGRAASFLHDLGRRWREHGAQDGAVRAVDAESFANAPVRDSFSYGSIQRGRDLNALLLAFAALLLYLMALEMGVSPTAAAFAGLLLAAQPCALEHAHYCETDTAVPFALCLAGWLAARGANRRSMGWHLAGMAAAGFAIACKYTLMPLVLWPLAAAVPLAVARDGERRSGARALGIWAALAAAGLVALAAGFLVGTPPLLRSPRWFLASARHISALTFAEGLRSLGPAYYDRWARVAWRASSLLREMLRLGVFPLTLFAASLPFWGRRLARLYLGTFPLLLAVFVPYAVFLMPWIRPQELLPALPPLCLGAGLAADWALGAIRRGHGASRPARRIAAALLLALAAIGFVWTLRDGHRVLTAFQRRDTRAECQNWLADCAPRGLRLALDHYVAQSIRGTPCVGVDWPGVPETWPAFRDEPVFEGNAPRYVLRNASFSGRRLLGPDAEENAAAFAREALPLRAWTLACGSVRTLPFAQPDIELWALPDPADASAPDIPVVLDRPVYFSPGLRPMYAAREFAPVGPVRAVPVVGQRHAVYPAPDAPSPSWAVVRKLAGPVGSGARARIEWNDIATAFPDGAVAIEIDTDVIRRRGAWDVRPGVRVRLRGANDQETICAGWIPLDLAETMRALRRGGGARGALGLLRGLPETELDFAAKTEAFLAAVEAGEAPEPGWRAAARAALAALEETTNPAPRVRGVPMRVLRDFAQLRLRPGPFPAPDTLPVFLPRGTYSVSVRIDPESPPPAGELWFEEQTAPAEERVDDAGRAWRDAMVVMRRGALLRTRPAARTTEAVQGLAFRELEIAWDPAEQLFSEFAVELRTALKRDGAP